MNQGTKSLLACISIRGFLGSSNGKGSACNVGDLGSIPGERKGTPPHYSCLANSMDRGGWWATVQGVAKSRTRLSDFTHSLCVFWPEIPILYIYPEKTVIQKDSCTPMFITALLQQPRHGNNLNVHQHIGQKIGIYIKMEHSHK